MGKAYRKPRPSPPKYYWIDTDYCWNCPKDKRLKACNGCSRIKKYIHSNDRGKRRREKQLIKQGRY